MKVWSLKRLLSVAINIFVDIDRATNFEVEVVEKLIAGAVEIRSKNKQLMKLQK